MAERPPPELAAEWNRILADEGLAILDVRGKTPREKRVLDKMNGRRGRRRV